MQNNKSTNVIDFGELVMDEIGLYADPNGRVVDQQTDTALQIKGKNLKFPIDESVKIGRNEIEFDPLNNQTLANSLFGFYLSNRFNEDGSKYISSYATVADNANKAKGTLEVKVGPEVMVSGEYYRDSVKYVDMIMRMNGDSNANLNRFDMPMIDKKKGKK